MRIHSNLYNICERPCETQLPEQLSPTWSSSLTKDVRIIESQANVANKLPTFLPIGSDKTIFKDTKILNSWRFTTVQNNLFPRENHGYYTASMEHTFQLSRPLNACVYLVIISLSFDASYCDSLAVTSCKLLKVLSLYKIFINNEPSKSAK